MGVHKVRIQQLVWLLALGLAIPTLPSFGQEQKAGQEQDSTASRQLSWDEQEEFLKEAKSQDKKRNEDGVTGTLVVTLVGEDGFTHQASFQSIDQFKQVFQPPHGPTQFGFKDTYKYNIAAWRLAREIGLGDMVPPSVRRKYSGDTGAMTWWVDDVLMEERERLEKKIDPPDQEAWRQQMALVRVFDQLIENTDRNQGNLVIDKDWHIWMIDHTRAFRRMDEPEKPAVLSMIDRTVLGRLRLLNKDKLKKLMGNNLTNAEIEPLLKRRDKIVERFDSMGTDALFSRTAAAEGE